MAENGVRRVVVAGGGITGLSAAYYLKKAAAARGLPLELTLVEAENRLGGKIATMRLDGFVLERGPDSFLARKPAFAELVRDLGLGDRLVGIDPASSRTYVLIGGRLRAMPPGLSLGVPTRFLPFAFTPLLTPAGKLRAALDLVLPRRKNEDDEPLGRFLSRRLGQQVLERIAEPLLSGIYAGDVERLSLEATFPQFREMERRYGSLIRGMRAARRTAQAARGDAEAAAFLTVRDGLETVVEALAEKLSADRLLLGRRVEALFEADGLSHADQRMYRVRLDDGGEIDADGVLLALPNFAVARLVGAFCPSAGRLADTSYASVANVVLIYPPGVRAPFADGSGFLVPRREKRFITACTWTSVKWPHTAPPGRFAARCYVGRHGDEAWRELDDGELVRCVLGDLADIVGLRAEPERAVVTRWKEAMPQYAVGHARLVREAKRQLAERLPGVWIAGAGLEGVGLPDCVRQGRQAAEQLADWLAGRPGVFSAEQSAEPTQNAPTLGKGETEDGVRASF